MVFLKKIVSDTFHEFIILLIPIQPTKWNNDVASKEEEPYFRFSEELISLSHRTTRLIENSLRKAQNGNRQCSEGETPR